MSESDRTPSVLFVCVKNGLRVGDGTAIRRTSPSSGETMVTWTPAGMVAVD
jgi:hypothetical protein